MKGTAIGTCEDVCVVGGKREEGLAVSELAHSLAFE